MRFTSTTGGEAVPLKSVHVRATLLDMVAKVVVMQHYHNSSQVPIEAKYVCPLDEMAAVCGFEAFINGKHIIGEVKEKEKAHNEYKEAVAAGHGAYLMDEEKPDVFTVSVGNLVPRTTRTPHSHNTYLFLFVGSRPTRRC
jgi:poly [ADP-ribose] polymerase